MLQTTARLMLPGLLLLCCFTAPALAESAADIYQQPVPQMTTLECAKCHPQIFETLRDHGGLHQQPCRDCHQRFHSFTPGTPWEDRVPSCASCHEQPHGKTLTECLSCHQNAHAPIDSLVAAEKLADKCQVCHQPQAEALSRTSSGHSELGCFECHAGARHGFMPQCVTCHAEPHTAYVDNAGCTACHPAHEPTLVRYDTTVPDALCGGCHAKQLHALQKTDKKHRALACAVCHPTEHGNIYSCHDCHENGPHNPALLKNFSSCSDCHGDPHLLKLSD